MCHLHLYVLQATQETPQNCLPLYIYLSSNYFDWMLLLLLMILKVVVENDDLLLRAGMMNGKDASRMSTPVSATETILPPTKNLSVEEIETLKKAMANKTVSRKTFFNKRTRVKHLPLPSTRSFVTNR